MKQLKMKDIEKHINIMQPSFIYYIRQVPAVVDEGPGQGQQSNGEACMPSYGSCMFFRTQVSFLRKHRVFVVYKHLLYHKNA